jgi:hypothetical protein
MFKNCHFASPHRRMLLRLQLGLFCFLTFAGLSMASAGSVATLIPTNCCAVISVQPTTELRPLLNASTLAAVRAPALEQYKASFLQRWTNSVGQDVVRVLGLGSLLKSVPGTVTFALIPSSESETNSSLSWALVLDSGSNSNAASAWLARQREDWRSAGSLETRQIAGSEYSSVALTNQGVRSDKAWHWLTTAGAGAAAEDPRILVGQRGSLLLFSPSSNVLSGFGPVHGTNLFSAVEQSAANAAAWGWCDVRVLERLLSKWRGSAEAGLNSRFQLLTKAAGISEADFLRFTLRTNAGGVLLDTRLHLSRANPAGLAAVFSKPSGAGIPLFVPDNVERFQQWHFEGSRLWTSLETTLAGISGQAKRGLDFLLETAEIAAQMKKPQFNLRTNLLTNIGDDLCYWQQPGTNSADALEKILVFSSPNPEELAFAFKSMLVLVSADAEKPQERDFEGRKVFSVPLPPANLAGLFTIPRNTTLHYAFNTQYVAVATGPSILEDFLNRAEKPSPGLSGREGIANALTSLMAGPALVNYQNDRAVLSRSWPVVQSHPEHLVDLLLPEPLPSLIRPLLVHTDVADLLSAGSIPPFSDIESSFSSHLNAAGFAADEVWFQTYFPFVR